MNSRYGSRTRHRARLPAAALLVLAAPAAAQDTEIVVTGGDLESLPAERAYDVVILDRDSLNGTAAGRVEDALRDVAGLQQFRRTDARSANPTSQGVTLRGLGGNAASRALLMLDGVPQADPFGGWVSWPAFTPERLGEARVTRGGGSGLFGSGALAGTIELASATPEQLGRFSGGVHYGSRDSIDADAGLSAPLGGGFATISADYARGNGFIPIVEGQRGLVDKPAGYNQASVALRGVIPVGANGELQASLLAFRDRRNRGFDFSDSRDDGADASIRYVGRGRWGMSLVGYLQSRSFASGFASIGAGRQTVTAALDQYEVPSTGLGARAEIRPPIGGDVDLRIGGDWRHVSGKTQELYQFVAASPTRGRVAGGENMTAGIFADASVSVGDAVVLTGGARIDRWRIASGYRIERTLTGGIPLTDEHYADRTGWEPTGRLGVAWQANDAVSLRAAGYLGWRLPTLNELYRPFRVGADATAADPTLLPERVAGFEAGMTLRPASGIELSVTAFDNRLRNAIANVSISNGPGTFPGVGFVSAAGVYRRRANLGSVHAQGVELDASIPLSLFRLAGSYAYTRSTVRASGIAASLEGLAPAQTPRHQASASIGWTPRAEASATLGIRYVSSQFEDDQNIRTLNGVATVHGRIAWSVRPGVVIEARGENLFDALVEAAVSNDGVIERATPRTLWLGLRLKL